MSSLPQDQLDDLAERGMRTLGHVMLAALGGAVVAVAGIPRLAPQMAQTVAGSDGSVFWLLSRSSSFVALLLLWGSIMLGLALTSRLARIWPGGPAAVDLHQHLSLLALGFMSFHALILLGDAYIHISLIDVLIPFASRAYRPGWVGMGQLAIYMMALVTGSFYVRKRLGHAAWRAIHFLSFTLFILALAHGWMSGSDSSAPWAQVIYWTTGLSTAFMTLYRVIVLAPGRQRKPAAA